MQVDSIEVDLDHQKSRPAQTGDAPAAETDTFNVRVRVTGQIDEQQRQRLEYIAGRCPVHRTLNGKPEVTHSVTVVPS